MIKDLVVSLALSGPHAAADYAISIADIFQAHACGVAFRYDPTVTASVLGGESPGLIDREAEENAKAAKAAADRFQQAADRAGVSAETQLLDASLAGAAQLFGQFTRRFDLAVVGQSSGKRSMPEELIIEGALFESGRPVIVVPYIQNGGMTLNRAVVCWDGGRMAARALADAMPFIERARQIDVVIVTDDPGKRDEIPGADIGAHLARHGHQVEVKRLTTGGTSVADTIISYVTDADADFLVMGGYGHSRLREFILGGVTRKVLAEMTVPVLMSH